MQNKLDIFKITIDPEYSENGEDLGIDQIAFTSNPAILVKGLAFHSQQPNHKYFFNDDVKMRIAAPALIPMNIYRNDDMGEYYVQFTKEEIEKIFVKFMGQLNNKGKFNEEHNTDKTVPAFILEAWLVGEDTKADRSYSTFGVDIPAGTIFIVAQVTDRKYYDYLVKNNQIGFSIEGFLGLKLSEKAYQLAAQKFQSYTDYPKAATDNAKRALKYKEENGSKCGTGVGWARARQLAGRQPISEETINRMSAFRRQQQYKDVPYDKGCGGIMWDAWGGDEGIAWAARKAKQLKEEKNKLIKTKMEKSNKKKQKFAAIKLAAGKLVEGGELTLITIELVPEAAAIVIDENLEIIEDYTGEIMVDEKTVVLEDGFIVEVIEEEIEIEVEAKKEEMAEVIEEEVKKEEVKMAIDEIELMTILQPKFDEIYQLIADLKAGFGTVKEEEIIKEEKIEMDIHQKFANAINFLKNR
jgi:hypothetical protein